MHNNKQYYACERIYAVQFFCDQLLFFFVIFHIDDKNCQSEVITIIIHLSKIKMGKVLAKLMKKLSADGPKRILMLGLDNAGKMIV